MGIFLRIIPQNNWSIWICFKISLNGHPMTFSSLFRFRSGCFLSYDFAPPAPPLLQTNHFLQWKTLVFLLIVNRSFIYIDFYHCSFCIQFSKASIEGHCILNFPIARSYWKEPRKLWAIIDFKLHRELRQHGRWYKEQKDINVAMEVQLLSSVASIYLPMLLLSKRGRKFKWTPLARHRGTPY